MKKITLNTIILTITISILLIILILATGNDIFSIFFILFILFPTYYFTSLLVESNQVQQITSNKVLKYISYFVFVFIIILFIPFIVHNYFPDSISFLVDYNGDLYEFMKYSNFSYSLPFHLKPFIEIIELFFALDIFFISIGLAVLLKICFKIFEIEKREVKKLNLSNIAQQ